MWILRLTDQVFVGRFSFEVALLPGKPPAAQYSIPTRPSPTPRDPSNMAELTKARRHPQDAARDLIGSAVLPQVLFLAAALYAYRDLIGFDPYTATASDVGGAEGALFSPVGSNWGFVVLVFTIKLFEKRGELYEAMQRPGSLWTALPLFLASLAVYGWARFTGAVDILIPSLSLLLVGSGFLFGGRNGARILLSPAVILLFGIPIPGAVLNAVLYQMQIATAQFAAQLTELAGVWSVQIADLIFTENHIFQVIESCAGFRTLQTLLLVAFIIPGKSHRTRLHALVLFAITPFVAFFLNGVRVLLIMLNPLSHFGLVHTTQGLVTIVAGVLTLAAIESALAKLLGPRAVRQLRNPSLTSRRRVLIMAASLAGLGLSSVGQPYYDGETLHWQSFRQLYRLPDLKARALKVDAEYLGSVGFTQKAYTRYEFEGEPVDVFIGLNNRTERHKSLISLKTIYLLPGLHVEEEEPIQIGVADTPATLVVASRGPAGRVPTDRTLAIHWYQGTRSLPEEALRSALALDQSPFRRSDREIVVRLSTPLRSGPAERNRARMRLEDAARRFEANLARERG
jgi:exosortase